MERKAFKVRVKSSTIEPWLFTQSTHSHFYIAWLGFFSANILDAGQLQLLRSFRQTESNVIPNYTGKTQEVAIGAWRTSMHHLLRGGDVFHNTITTLTFNETDKSTVSQYPVQISNIHLPIVWGCLFLNWFMLTK